MRQLIPEPHRSRADAEPELSRVYAYPRNARRWLRANLVASVDGLAQADGASRGLSGPGLAAAVSVWPEPLRLEAVDPGAWLLWGLMGLVMVAAMGAYGQTLVTAPPMPPSQVPTHAAGPPTATPR